MSVKKMLLLGATSVAAVAMTAAVAGGYTHEPVAQMQQSDMSYYIEGNVGYGFQNYYDQKNWVANSGVRSRNWNNSTGGFAGGVDVGYNINNNYAIELGWFWLPQVNVASSAVPSTYLTSWALYLAAKYMVPLSSWMNNTDWFFKLGAEYRRATVSTTDVVTGSSTLGISSGTSSMVRPMFATGLDYSFSNSWTGIIQYAYFMGADNSFPFSTAANGSYGTVAANVLTLGLGYKFSV